MNGRRDTGDEPAAADRNDHRVELRKLLEQLEPDRALAGDHGRVVERMNVDRPRLVAELARMVGGFVVAGTVRDHVRAVALGGLHLHERCRLGHHDGGLHPEA